MFLKKQFDDEHPLHEVANLEGWEEVNKFIKSIAGPEMTEAHNITTGGGKKGGRGTKRKATESKCLVWITLSRPLPKHN